MHSLTKVTGGTVASLDFKIKNLDALIKEVKKEAAAANSRATASNNTAEDAKKNLKKLYQTNASLKK